jgi:hypothetical protein
MLVLYEHHFSLNNVASKALGDSKLCSIQPSATRSSHCSLRLTKLMITSPNSSLELLQHCLLPSKRPQRTSGWLRELIRVREILHTDTPRMERYVSEFDEVRAQHGLSCLTAPFAPSRNVPEIPPILGDLTWVSSKKIPIAAASGKEHGALYSGAPVKCGSCVNDGAMLMLN